MQSWACAHPPVGVGSPFAPSTNLPQQHAPGFGCCTAPTRSRRRAERSQHVALAATSPPPSTAAPTPRPLVQECSVHDWRSPLRCDATPHEADRDIVVALGKFDAMHLGHQSLAIKAAQNGCQPVLLSFSGMAQVLGWPEKLPLVAAPDRPRVLASWTSACNGRVPRQRLVPFHEIRMMPPEDFVAVLAQQLGAAGVVAGSNYRFGYKAAGDACALQELGAKYGMKVHIVELVPEASVCPQSDSSHTSQSALAQQISSSKIRDLLAVGNVSAVQRLLGRRYRLVARSKQAVTIDQQPQAVHAAQQHNGAQLAHGDIEDFVPVNCYLNQPPAPGLYEVHAAWVPLPSGSGSLSQPLQLQALSSQPLSVPMQVLASAVNTNGHCNGAGRVGQNHHHHEQQQHGIQQPHGQQPQQGSWGASTRSREDMLQGFLPACSSSNSDVLLPAEAHIQAPGHSFDGHSNGSHSNGGSSASQASVLQPCHCRVTAQGVQMLDMPADGRQLAGLPQACLVIDFECCISTV